jgi:Putative DNA-binding domain
MWILFPQLVRANPKSCLARSLRSTRTVDYALARQRPELNIVKHEKWTEVDVDELPAEEPDVFERKSGELFANRGKFLDSVAKAISAFANSGGGSLILGVKDDGTSDGLPPLVGRTAMRDWVEQKIPQLLDYLLADFRVHTVIKSDPSRIPDGREVVVIDVGDSAAAPHQSKRDKIYYRREGGRSVPAPHFYLELLRQRLTNPTLEFTLKKIDPVDITEHDNGLFLVAKLRYEIKNVGRVAAYNWQLNIRAISHLSKDLNARASDYCFGTGNFPVKKMHLTEVPINTTILPECKCREAQDFGLQLRPNAHTIDAVREEIEAPLDGTIFSYQLATETSPGELMSIPLSPVLDMSLRPDRSVRDFSISNVEICRAIGPRHSLRSSNRYSPRSSPSARARPDRE